MQRLEIPTPTPDSAPTPNFAPRRKADHIDPEYVPILLQEMQDDLTRSRIREALWISLVVHLVVVILLVLSPKWMPGKQVRLLSAEELLRNKDLTYLQMPKDAQTPPVKPPQSSKLSDKNRIATSRHPQIDRKTLEELRDAMRRGAPGPQSQPQQQVQQPAPQQQAPPRQEAAIPPNQNSESQFHAPVQPKQNPFAAALSPGSAIQQAAHAAPRPFSGGGGGDYGSGMPSPSKVHSNIDILSDTQGVDFGPYLNRVLQSVRMNWYNLIPEIARPPMMKKGKVTIEFAILPDGKVAGMRVVNGSSDVALDRAAWGGISASNPFGPLPNEFKGPYLALRFHFFYNPDRNEMD